MELEFTGERVVPDKTPYEVYQEHLNRYKFASQSVTKKVVLDAGCGVGYGSSYLLRKRARCVLGVDISSSAIKYAQIDYARENLFFIRGDVARLPFQDEFFDIVVSFEVIEHISHYADFLKECKGVLKSGGLFICSTPNAKSKMYSFTKERS